MKKDLNQFINWTRNGTCFAFTWLLFLSTLGASANGRAFLTTGYLLKLLALCLGGALLFSLCFTKGAFKKLSFSPRLTIFFWAYGIYQALGFRWLGISFPGKISEWIFYLGFLLISFLASWLIYRSYSKKMEAKYTEILKDYQKRRTENENC